VFLPPGGSGLPERGRNFGRNPNLLAQGARQGPYNDCATSRPLVSAAHEVTPVGLVLADAEFDSERNHLYFREVIGADSVIPREARQG
jgi:hypothetical protein